VSAWVPAKVLHPVDLQVVYTREKDLLELDLNGYELVFEIIVVRILLDLRGK